MVWMGAGVGLDLDRTTVFFKVVLILMGGLADEGRSGLATVVVAAVLLLAAGLDVRGAALKSRSCVREERGGGFGLFLVDCTS